jgi:hypothetical protein
MTWNQQPRKPVESAVEMAIAAVEDSPRPSPLDQDMSAVGPYPTSLDLTLPGKPDDRPDAAGPGAARGGAKGRSLQPQRRSASWSR